MAASMPAEIPVAGCWTAIRRADRPLAVEARDIGHLAGLADDLAVSSPFERRGEGPMAAAVAGLGDVPELLAADIRDLAHRFAHLMQVGAVRIRLEGIASNACRKIHSDYTDVRLITTYSGPGTDYLPQGLSPSDENLVRLHTAAPCRTDISIPGTAMKGFLPVKSRAVDCLGALPERPE